MIRYYIIFIQTRLFHSLKKLLWLIIMLVTFAATVKGRLYQWHSRLFWGNYIKFRKIVLILDANIHIYIGLLWVYIWSEGVIFKDFKYCNHETLPVVLKKNRFIFGFTSCDEPLGSPTNMISLFHFWYLLEKETKYCQDIMFLK